VGTACCRLRSSMPPSSPRPYSEKSPPERACPICGVSFVPSRINATYCSHAGRQRTYRYPHQIVITRPRPAPGKEDTPWLDLARPSGIQSNGGETGKAHSRRPINEDARSVSVWLGFRGRGVVRRERALLAPPAAHHDAHLCKNRATLQGLRKCLYYVIGFDSWQLPGS
jgi:hypothetical protein